MATAVLNFAIRVNVFALGHVLNDVIDLHVLALAPGLADLAEEVKVHEGGERRFRIGPSVGQNLFHERRFFAPNFYGLVVRFNVVLATFSLERFHVGHLLHLSDA